MFLHTHTNPTLNWMKKLSKIIQMQFAGCKFTTFGQTTFGSCGAHQTWAKSRKNQIQADLVICGLFICEFTYMRLRIILIYRTYPLIYSHPWSFYMQICYIRVIFYGHYLLHITRSACTALLIIFSYIWMNSIRL